MEKFYIDDQVQAIRLLHKDILDRDPASLTVLALLEAQALTLLNAHRDGLPAVVFHLACWCPGLVGKSPAEIMRTELTLGQAQLSMAREYGYGDWAEVEAVGASNFDREFEEAVGHLIHGGIDGLNSMLESNSELVRARSPLGHRATLLHYTGANGVETQRQVTPYNAVAITQVLIDAGADVNAVANMYGGSTVLQLVETSAHPRRAGVTDQLVCLLKSRGAR